MICHFADTYSDSLRAPLYGEMLGVDTLVSGRLNFFSPYYRQCSLQSFESDSLTVARMPLALGDVRRAFQYYLEHQNGGRPFILLPVTEQKKDTMTVHLDTASGLLIVDGYTAQDYMLPLLGVEGNYHTREIWLYRDQLRENMALRAREFIQGKKQ